MYQLVIKNGDKIPITGYYKYIGHKNPKEYNQCLIVPSMYNMFFKKGKSAMSTGSCKHDIQWALVKPYKS